MTQTTTLICPKCQGAMRTYERSGIAIDQCTECRGIFLDRGELERLMDAEMAVGGDARSGGYAGDPGRDTRGREYGGERDDEHARHDRDDRDDQDDSWRRRDVRDSRGRPIGGERRRESRFGSLFDLFGGD